MFLELFKTGRHLHITKWLMVFFAFFGQVSAQSRLPERLDSLLADMVNEETPGCAVGVVWKGNVIFTKGYGMANLSHNIPFSPVTVADIGSVAKQITCYAVIKLAEQAEISLDDDIRKFLPWVPDFGSPITISHLIHHISGLREIYAMLSLGGYRSGDGIRQEDAKAMVQNAKELNFEPGSQFMYCNTAYMLLADIVEAVTETGFESWMKANVFDPLEMDQSFIMDVQGENFPGCADSYLKLDSGAYSEIYDNSTAYGQGGIYMTANDLMKWLKNLMYPRESDSNIVRQMMSRGVLNNGEELDYAFGLVHGEYRGLAQVGHSGSSAGYRAMLSFFPDHELGITLQANSPEIDLRKIQELILDEMLGKFLGPVEQVETSPPAGDELEDLGTYDFGHDLNDYEGVYFCPEVEAIYQMRVDGTSLVAHHRRHGEIPLTWNDEDHFTSDAWFFPELKFFRNGSNLITGFRLSGGRILGIRFEKMQPLKN